MQAATNCKHTAPSPAVAIRDATLQEMSYPTVGRKSGLSNSRRNGPHDFSPVSGSGATETTREAGVPV